MRPHHTDSIACLIPECLSPIKNPFIAAVLTAHPMLSSVKGDLFCEVILDGLDHPLDIIGMHKLRPGSDIVGNLVLLKPAHFLTAGGENHFAGLHIPVPNAIIVAA